MLYKIVTRSKLAQPDSLEECFQDWLALSRYTGFQRSGWAQTRKLSYKHINDDTSLPARAMLDEDWTFYHVQGLLLYKIPTNQDKVHREDICWRVQKNGQCNERISFSCDNLTKWWCLVRAVWRICMRAHRLEIPPHKTLVKYKDHAKNRVVFLNTSKIEAIIWAVAKIMTGILYDNVINMQYGPHSIRVTACNELARLGASDTFIQKVCDGAVSPF